MITIGKSPRAAAGLPAPARSRRRVGDWNPFHVGELVTWRDDERHVGQVVGVSSSLYVHVRWLDTGWRTTTRARHLVTAGSMNERRSCGRTPCPL